ncbi:MAG: 2-oxo acid dehydrogenase subunit E2 [Candidatus Dormibacteraeota bacterium]|nr:2-oxo acid dehydrogenase subunit E2 [Candidatus Dormibacteraeota bacterium]
MTVNMPQLGESVTEGTIARWLKQPGETVAKYESIAEVVTDKVNAEIPAPADGTMGELIAKEGQVVAVGEPIATIETGSGDGTAAPASQPAAASAQPAQAPQPAAASAQPAQAPQPAPAAAAAPEPRAESRPEPEREPQPQAAAVATSTSGNGTAGYHLTPAVRMLVREHSVDLSQIQGSGIGGRITKKDVLDFVQRRGPAPASQPQPQSAAAAAAPTTQTEQPAQAAQPAAAAAAPQPAATGEGDTLIAMTSARRSTADHMVRSKQTSPHAYCMFEVDMSAVFAARAKAKAEFEQRYGVNLTFLPFVARAVCEGLRRHPTLNATWTDEGIVLKRDIHLGIAVALEDKLVVPVVRNADRLNIAGLATTMSELGERARQNRLKLDEIQGGTFTLNNTGALGAVITQAIINQPQAAIMTMDLVVKRAVVISDAIAIRPMMNLGLSFDHRINDGLQATRFVKTVKELLEGFDPSGSLL